MKKFLLILMLIVLMFSFGCASLGDITGKVDPPEACPDSVIYKTIPNPALADTLFVISVYELAKNKPEWKEGIIEVLDEFDALLDTEITYLNLAALIISKIEALNQNFGVELIIISEYLFKFEQPELLLECDKEMLRAHIKKQKLYVGMVKAA